MMGVTVVMIVMMSKMTDVIIGIDVDAFFLVITTSTRCNSHVGSFEVLLPVLSLLVSRRTISPYVQPDFSDRPRSKRPAVPLNSSQSPLVADDRL